MEYNDKRDVEFEEQIERFVRRRPDFTTPGAKHYFARVWKGYAVLAAAIVIGLFLGFRSDNKIDREVARNDMQRYEQCVDNRLLIQSLILRSVNSTPRDWKSNSDKVIREYRKYLLGFQVYREDERLLDRTLDNTRETLNLSEPEACVK